MSLPNVNRILYQRNPELDAPLLKGEEHPDNVSVAAFKKKYHIDLESTIPGGANVYYGVVQAQVDAWERTRRARALQPHHYLVIEDVLQHLVAASPLPSAVINFSLLPLEPDQPYGFVEKSPELLAAVAAELRTYQLQAVEHGKRLRIVIRYASEMNGARIQDKNPQPWGYINGFDDQEQQEKFRRTFVSTREIFREHAPTVEFAFSPFIRSDLKPELYDVLPKYWPGDDQVDVIGCTWYIGTEADQELAFQVMQRYCADYARKGKPFGVDEMGGIWHGGDPKREPDRMLAAMFRFLAELGNAGAFFLYASVFLEHKWQHARLKFLRTASG